jgi:uncharacterized protein YbjT (DUF2867 family)
MTLQPTNTGKAVVVAGATGLVGRQLVAALLASPYVARVKALVRRSGSFALHARLEEVVLPSGGTGYSELRDLKAPAFQGDVYFCCLGTTRRKAGSPAAFRAVDFDATLTAARLAAEQGALSFVLISSVGANPSSIFLYPRVKGEVEQSIVALSIPRVVIYRPSFLVAEQKRPERRFGEELGIGVYRVLESFLPATLKTRLGTPVEVLVKAMLHDGLLREDPGRFTVEAAEVSQRLS